MLPFVRRRPRIAPGYARPEPNVTRFAQFAQQDAVGRGEVDASGSMALPTTLLGGLLLALSMLTLGGSWLYEVQTHRQIETLQHEHDEIMERSRNRVRALAVTPDGGTLACGVEGGDICFWNIATGLRLPKALKHDGGIQSLAFSPDGKHLVAGGGHRPRLLAELRVWNWKTGELVAELDTSAAVVQAVAFSPDGRLLAASATDGILRIWHAPEHDWAAQVRVSKSAVAAVAFAPDGKTLATATDDGQLATWSTFNWQQQAHCRAHEGVMWALIYSPDGQRLASTGADGRVRLWNPADLSPQQELPRSPDHGRALAFSPDSRELTAALGTSGSPPELRRWDLHRGLELRPLQGHADVVYALARTSTGNLIVTGSGDGTIRFWDAATGLTVHTLRLCQ